MPVFTCSCGIDILIIPDIPSMNKAIQDHILEHQELVGEGITEEILTQEILRVVLDAINEKQIS